MQAEENMTVNIYQGIKKCRIIRLATVNGFINPRGQHDVHFSEPKWTRNF